MNYTKTLGIYVVKNIILCHFIYEHTDQLIKCKHVRSSESYLSVLQMASKAAKTLNDNNPSHIIIFGNLLDVYNRVF